MRHPSVVAALAVLGLSGLTGCADDGSSDDLAPYSPGAAVSAAVSAAQQSAANASAAAAATNSGAAHLAQKEVGEQATLADGQGPVGLTFVVTAIRPDVTCDDPAVTPGSGHFIAVDLTVTTSASLTTALQLGAADFSIVAEDGTTDAELVGRGAGCLRTAFSDAPLVAGETRAGTIVLDAEHVDGVLTFLPRSLERTAGWQYQL